MKQMTFAAAIKDFFGFLPGQTVGGFAAEIKALTAEDRQYFKREFVKVGYDIIGL